MNPLFRFPIANRPLRIETPLGSDFFAVTSVVGREGLSELYEFRVELVADRYSAFDFPQVLGQAATLRIAAPESGERIIHGLVTELAHTADDETLARYSLTVAPKLWMWNLKAQCRIFQQLSVPEILEKVLDGIEHQLKLSGVYRPRDYCVQYNETDFAFASRLMEEEGLFYYFEHRDDGHALIITDDVANLPDANLTDTLLFEPDLGGKRSLARIWKWCKRQQLTTTRYALRDQCFELPGQTFDTDAALVEDVQVGPFKHSLACNEDEREVYYYPGVAAKWFDGVNPSGGDRAADLQNIYEEKDRLARLHAESAAVSAIEAGGTSNALLLQPGQKFFLARHGWGDGKYLVRSVEHRASLRLPTRSGDEEVAFKYENDFVALPDQLPFRAPRTTPSPRIDGLQTAIVTGPSGQEIFCDKYGRIKVQFPWDRQGKLDADSSCWVRVAQFWAGKRFGAFFWPRIGHEVVVAFEDGDPDRPLIIGSTYNAANMPPLDMPDDAKLTGIKSCIYGGDPMKNFNAVVFHDVPGSEYVQVHSETHASQNSESDHFEFVPDTHYSFHGSF